MLVDRLAAAGHLEFMPNPAHKRSDLVRLTEQGNEMLDSATEREAKFLARLLPHISEAELTSATALLQRLRTVLAGQEWDASADMTVAKPRTTVRRKKPQSPKLGKRAAPVLVEPTLADAPPTTAAWEGDELPVNLL